MNKTRLTVIILCLIALSCKRDCKTKAVEMQMKPIVDYETSQNAYVDGYDYYISQFQKGSINFLINFVHQGAGEFCDYEWISYPVDNGMRIRCGKTIVLNEDTIPANQTLNDYFEIQKMGPEFRLQYLIESVSTVPDSGLYKFIGELELDDGTFLYDSVIIEMN